MYQCELDHHIIKSDAHRPMTARFPSLSTKNYKISHTKLPFFAEVITQLARFSQFEYLTKHEKNSNLQDHKE